MDKEMKSVWLIEDYKNSVIIGVYSSKELAIEKALILMEKYNYDKFDVEVWEHYLDSNISEYIESKITHESICIGKIVSKD